MNISRRHFLSPSAKTAAAVTLLNSFSPARVLAQAAAVRTLQGALFGLEGDAALPPVLEGLVGRLGGRALWLRAEDKPL